MGLCGLHKKAQNLLTRGSDRLGVSGIAHELPDFSQGTSLDISTIMIILLIWLAVLATVVILYLRQVYSRFDRYGVKHLSPFPFVGNMGQMLLGRQHFAENIQQLYNAFPGERFVGRFEFINEMIMIRDLDLVKKIAVKDFEYFIDHRTIFSESDPFFGRNLFSLKGEEWKDMRSTLSPAFTSSKMRLMVPFMVEVGDHMMQAIKKKIDNAHVGYVDIECKDLTTRYANDVIASCAFGLKVDSHTEENNDFYANGKVASSFNFRQMMIVFCITNFPKVMKFLNISVFAESTKKFFKNLVLSTMKDRELRRIIRPDMIHILMEVKKGKLTHEEKSEPKSDAGFATVEESSVGKKEIKTDWSDDDLIAQAVLFFIAGFETVSSAMSFLLYELALNPEVQERLAEEIKENDSKHGGKFDFNSIQSMPYLDMVVSELLRLWPPAIGLDRLCQKDYNIGKPNENSKQDFIVRKGTGLLVPAFAIHRDPQYYPDPEKFDPERFSEENKHNINPFSYMPFGIGPRNCIGSRFALCEVKVMTYQILQQLVISPCEKTCIPAVLSTETFNIKLKGGHWLRFRVRE